MTELPRKPQITYKYQYTTQFHLRNTTQDMISILKDDLYRKYMGEDYEKKYEEKHGFNLATRLESIEKELTEDCLLVETLDYQDAVTKYEKLKQNVEDYLVKKEENENKQNEKEEFLKETKIILVLLQTLVAYDETTKLLYDMISERIVCLQEDHYPKEDDKH